MATITRIPRKSGTVYKARVRRPGQPQLSKTFTNKSDASKWARRQEVSIERDQAGLISPASRMTLNQAWERYQREVLPEFKEESARKYRQHMNYWQPLLGSLSLDRITPARISELRDELATGKRPATVNRYLATLASVFTAAVKRWHLLPVSPVHSVAKLSENNERKAFLTEEQTSALLAACRQSESPDLYLAVLLSITTGMRAGECLGLRWNQVDLKRRLITLTDTKNKDSRSLPIVEEITPLLEARRAGKVVVLSGLVFPSRVSRNRPIKLRKSWLTALKKAGIDSFHWHDLRHSCASFLAKNGASLLEIGQVLGHRSQNTTARYSHLTEQHSHKLVERMAKGLLGGSDDE